MADPHPQAELSRRRFLGVGAVALGIGALDAVTADPAAGAQSPTASASASASAAGAATAASMIAPRPYFPAAVTLPRSV